MSEEKSVEQFEKELLEQAEKNQQDPVNLAATLFTIYLPRFQNLVGTLSSRALRRVLCALIEVPLNQSEFNHSTQQEKDCFAIGDRLLQAKWIMIQQAFMDNSKELHQATSSDVATEELQQPTNKEGENNG